eukprot:TRINITY_DN21676_c0_g1_i1.p1 TRINITY_DN21676_c0_g1~~TRINITY_DN21676_c0_g1_i1.p1  ORF type:complete len:522 (+),score=99.60 TRINITY_DN21676_c0_g1_i1:236-1801(+)
MAELPPLPPRRPVRNLDVPSYEAWQDLVEPGCATRGLVKSRAFPHLQDFGVTSSDVQVVLFDHYSPDSAVGCWAAQAALGESAIYVGVNRASVHEDLQDLAVDVCGKVVCMVGICWPIMALHELVQECRLLIIVHNHTSVQRELSGFADSYANTLVAVEPDMGVAALAWNFFHAGLPVPPLLRAIEDAELGRDVLRESRRFADGYEQAFEFEHMAGEHPAGSFFFKQVDDLLGGDGGRMAIQRAVEKGKALAPDIEGECAEAASSYKVRTLRSFPAWKCAVASSPSLFAGRLAEHLAAKLVEKCDVAPSGTGDARDVSEQNSSCSRCFGAICTARGSRLLVTLHSLPGGPDVSEITDQQDVGGGMAHRAFFSIDVAGWEAMWLQPEPILWDVVSEGPRCLSLARGEEVTVSCRGERFRGSPFDEWSYAYRSGDPASEGWVPTLAHTLLVSTSDVTSVGAGIAELKEGDLVVARGQLGIYLWGRRYTSAAQLSSSIEVKPEWFDQDTLQPVIAPWVKNVLGA